MYQAYFKSYHSKGVSEMRSVRPGQLEGKEIYKHDCRSLITAQKQESSQNIDQILLFFFPF